MSTSSSEYEEDDYWQYKTEYNYNTNFRNAFGRNPFYPAMGHPLVYYSEMEQPRKHRGRERQRGSPNCFVKAFRWYTKEHVPTRSVSPTKHKMSGFAAWLDTKYDEFLQDNHNVDSEMFRLKVKQTSVFEAERIPKNFYNNCESCNSGKKFTGKRPWLRKRRTKSNETRDIRQKSNHSFQFIMQPKETSRPTSECPNSSNADLMPMESSKKCLARSVSVSNITLVIKSKTPVNTALPPVEGGIKPKPSQNSTCKSLDSKNTVIEKALIKKNAESRDFGCQYCEEKAVKVNVETQYEVFDSLSTRISDPLSQLPRQVSCACATSDRNIKSVCCVCQSDLNQSNSVKCGCLSADQMAQKPVSKTSRDSQKIRVVRDHIDFECQCPEITIKNIDARTQYEEGYPKCTAYNTLCQCDNKKIVRAPPPILSTSKLNNSCPCEEKVNEELLTDKLSIVKFSQSTAQTSNHAICLGNKAVYEYPLFLKIVCADKL